MGNGGRGRNWVGIILAGCAGLLLLVALGVAALVFFVFGAIKRSDVYEQALAAVRSSPSAIAALGEPIEAGFLVSGSVNVSGGAGDANISFPVSGPSAKGQVHAAATREAGAWVFTALHLSIDGGETLDLLAESGGSLAGGGADAEAAAGDEAAITLPVASGDVLAALEQLAGAPSDVTVDPTMTLWVARQYSSWENPLHTEMAINGTTINIFTSDTFQPVAEYLRPGWNTLTMTTAPQEPAASGNALIFRIGPAQENEQGTVVMNPVVWTFRNDTDWSLAEGVYTHPVQPDPKQIAITYHLYYAGLDRENRELAAGDYVLQGAPQYDSWNTPVIGTAIVNGRALTSFLLESRQLVINDVLQQGRNEVQLIAMAVDNAISGNDVQLSLGGPAEWNEGQERFLLNPLVEMEASTGWTKDEQTGALVNPADPGQRVIVRSAPFFLQAAPPGP